ncbi:MAG: hypothetical protein CL841_02030 [Crocinitomicaceae bacterium]|nr:hypothetical protein [Crocinitomicaceae bacterium]
MRQIYHLKLQIVSTIIILLSFSTHFSQNHQVLNDVFSSNQAKIKDPLDQLSFSGNYRFLGFVRNQQEVFPNNSGKTTAIISGDFFREPMFLLKVKGKTKDNVSFGADLMINSLYKGPSEEFTRTVTLDLGLNIRTSINTGFGVFNFSSGGVSWYRQSRLTVWGNRSFNRISIYDRRPQNALTNIPNDRYNDFYKNGLIDQGIRYGSRAFQGLFLQGNKLPLNFSFKGVIGKSAFNRSFLEASDNFTTCLQINNQLNKNLKLSYNFLYSSQDLDSINNDKRKYNIHTFELFQKWKKINIHLESGFGNYRIVDEELGFGEAIILDVKTDKSSKIPLDFQFYRISPQFVNVTGNFLNTSVLEIFPNIPGVGTTIRTPFKSPMVGLGFPVNNRQGFSINSDIDFGKLKLNAGIGFFSEIDTSYAGISYRHNVNSQTLSRIYLFAQDWGPYNFLNSTYRGVFEEVSISDTNINGLANFKKFYNTIEFQAKYSNLFSGRKFYLFYLTRFNSCQRKLYSLPQFNDKALISQLSNEIDFSYEMNENAVLVLSYGIERVLGNRFTDLGDNIEPSSTNLLSEFLGIDKFNKVNTARNQRNRLIGIGFDYKIGENAMLFFRHNRYRYFDPNFVENHLQGTENMLELKITF